MAIWRLNEEDGLPSNNNEPELLEIVEILRLEDKDRFVSKIVQQERTNRVWVAVGGSAIVCISIHNRHVLGIVPQHAHTQFITAMVSVTATPPHSPQVWTCGRDNTLKVWQEVETPESEGLSEKKKRRMCRGVVLRRQREVKNLSETLAYHTALFFDGRWVWVGDRVGGVSFWQAENGRMLENRTLPHRNKITAFLLVSDTAMWCVSRDRTLSVWK